jgi:alkylation response protein AidB-like acyl-CoA dehydrogenase
MRTPGISIQPLVNLAGMPTFNQVFFDNVRVPARDLLGAIDGGWYVATTTLDFERSSIISSVDLDVLVHDLVDFARDGGALSPSARFELADRAIETQTGILLSYRVVSMQARGLVPNYEASINKLFGTEVAQRVARTAMRLAGQSAGLTGGPRSPLGGRPARLYLLSVASTIAGGTSEVQRMIIATRGLGLPRAD